MSTKKVASAMLEFEMKTVGGLGFGLRLVFQRMCQAGLCWSGLGWVFVKCKLTVLK